MFIKSLVLVGTFCPFGVPEGIEAVFFFFVSFRTVAITHRDILSLRFSLPLWKKKLYYFFLSSSSFFRAFDKRLCYRCALSSMIADCKDSKPLTLYCSSFLLIQRMKPTPLQLYKGFPFHQPPAFILFRSCINS